VKEESEGRILDGPLHWPALLIDGESGASDERAIVLYVVCALRPEERVDSRSFFYSL
jgi:hypothetical protein